MPRDLVSEIDELNQKHVHIKNRESLNQKLEGIINDGVSQLQVVSDFDLTITKQHENGKLHMSSFKMFTHCPSVTPEYLEGACNLTLKYRPYEYDPSVPLDLKRKYMEEWWSQSEKVLSGLKVSQDEIDDVISKLTLNLRDRTEDLFSALQESKVPILVFSAGLGDTVVSVLKKFQVMLPNVHVVSNFLKYDDNGTILGFKDTPIHVLNKNETAIKNSEYFELVKNRKNVLVLGDSLGDAKMADGMDHAHHIIKIGFIYENVEGNLPAYLDTFDIVLQDDQTMDVPRAIVNLIKK